MDIFTEISGGKKFSRKKTVETARVMGRYSTTWLTEVLLKSVPHDLSQHNRANLVFVLGLGRRPSLNHHASNVAVRAALIEVFIVSMLNVWEETMGREMQLLTITPDSWHVSENRPELRPQAWRAEAWRWLEKLGFTGVGIIEPAPFLNHPEAVDGRVFSVHLHAMGFADDPYTFKERVAEFNQTNAARCSIGAFAVSKPITLTEADVAMVAYYMLEPLHWAKRLTPSRAKEGKWLHRKAALPVHLALRCAEILSYLQVTDLIVTRGKAAWPWRQHLLSAVNLEHPLNSLQPHELDHLWRYVSRALPNRGYERVTFSE